MFRRGIDSRKGVMHRCRLRGPRWSWLVGQQGDPTMTNRPLILVTGATGNTGSGLVPSLLAAGARVRALVHTASKAEALRKQGAEVVVADLGDPAALAAAVAGVDKIYMCLFNGPEQANHGRNLIAAARRAGRPHIVHHAASGSDRSRIIRHINEVESA